MAAFYVYILENPAGRLYIGQTSDLDARIADHNSNGPTLGKFTRKNGPWQLLWSEPCPNRASAMRRESEIKSWKSARTIRERLLAGRVPARGINHLVVGEMPASLRSRTIPTRAAIRRAIACSWPLARGTEKAGRRACVIALIRPGPSGPISSTSEHVRDEVQKNLHPNTSTLARSAKLLSLRSQ